MAMPLILSYLFFDVVNTRDNDEQKGSKHTHSSPTACRTLDAGRVGLDQTAIENEQRWVT